MNNLTESQEALLESRRLLIGIVTEILEDTTQELRDCGLNVTVEPYRGMYKIESINRGKGNARL